MKIEFIEIANFRRLKSVRIDIDKDTTLLVGPNNSGKSSAVLALHRFLQEGAKFRLSDITLQNLPQIVKLGQSWTTKEDPSVTVPLLDNYSSLTDLLPTIDVWITASASELGRVPVAVPLLQDYKGGFGVRLRMEPVDQDQFRQEYVSKYQIAQTLRGTEEGVQLRPTDLVHYLETQLTKDFEIRGYLLDTSQIEGWNPYASPDDEYRVEEDQQSPSPQPSMQPLDADPTSIPPRLLRDLIRIDMISATRGVSDADAEGTSARLSGISSSFYEEHLHAGRDMSPADVAVIRAEQVAVLESNELAQGVFSETLEEIRAMGYPGGGDPRLIFESDLSFELPRRSMYLRHQIDVGMPTQRNLDESLNGLGYQSLIYMVFCLMNFRQARLRPTRPRATSGTRSIPSGAHEDTIAVAPIHLVLIEEPEAFLHAQVQQVFIKHAVSVLRKGNETFGHASLSSQLIVSTHSSHIVQEVSFNCIRYVRRQSASAENSNPVSTIVSLTSLFADDTELTRFTKRYVELNHCNLFFADALILVEGAAERMLLPEMLKLYPSIRAGYVELLQIRGSHAHKLRPLVEILGVPTLVITDIDAMELVPQDGQTAKGTAKADKRKKVMPQLHVGQITGNYTLSSWLGQGDQLDDLAKIDDELKVKETSGDGSIRFAYQAPLRIDQQVVPSTFEDALALANTSTISTLSEGPLVKKYRKIIERHKSTRDRASNFYRALNNADKGEFALNLLAEVPKGTILNPPEYIHEALQWLDIQLSKRGLFNPKIEIFGSAGKVVGK